MRRVERVGGDERRVNEVSVHMLGPNETQNTEHSNGMRGACLLTAPRGGTLNTVMVCVEHAF